MIFKPTIVSFQSESKPQSSGNVHQEADLEANSTASNGLTHTGDIRKTKGDNNTKNSRDASSKNLHQYEEKLKSAHSVEFSSEKRKPSLVAVLNQGLANLGERLCE
jgi:hypothetical protein